MTNNLHWQLELWNNEWHLAIVSYAYQQIRSNQKSIKDEYDVNWDPWVSTSWLGSPPLRTDLDRLREISSEGPTQNSLMTNNSYAQMKLFGMLLSLELNTMKQFKWNWADAKSGPCCLQKQNIMETNCQVCWSLRLLVFHWWNSSWWLCFQHL